MLELNSKYDGNLLGGSDSMLRTSGSFFLKFLINLQTNRIRRKKYKHMMRRTILSYFPSGLPFEKLLITRTKHV